MSENDFLSEMQVIMDTDKELFMEDSLQSYEEWDSLALVTFLSAMREHTEKKLNTKDVRRAKTIGDLYILFKKTQE